ncbi:protein FAM200C-like [Parasteatoda tepidariorum]|uniref:protein FAM200C-like n=1 Tax=Parasteatoda tepidariorum TaxID=114398 RepID=UPI0039BD173D
MQLGETTDISNYSQLLVFVRYVSLDTIKEEFLFCESLLQTTKAVDVLAMLNVSFTKQDFGWKEKLHSLRTDGAPVMLGNKSGSALLIKDELYIRHPFPCDIDCIDDMNLAKDELIDLRTKSLLKMDSESSGLL